MNKPDKCKNCQWYGKPYWSIINPCDNCPREDNTQVEIITRWQDPTINYYRNIIQDLEEWLNSEIKRIEAIKNPKHSTTFAPKPYGREREYYDIMINSYKYCLDKIRQLKEGK